MSRSLIVKTGAILVLLVLLLSLLTRIHEVIKERESYQAEASSKIAESSSKAQKLIGPILVVPYKVYKEVAGTIVDDIGGVMMPPRVTEERHRFFFPQEVLVEGNADVSVRKLGIYQAQVYSADLKWQGNFDVIDFKSIEQQTNFAGFGEPYLTVSVTDTRGIIEASNLTFNAVTYSFKSGSRQTKASASMHVPLSIEALQRSRSNQFSFGLQIQGTQELSVVPVGRKNDFKLSANWPHPSFLGETLPQTRNISGNGFNAHWQSSWFANSRDELRVDKQWSYLESESAPSFRVSLVEPVNEYKLNERSVKYGILFVGLTFIAFLVIELVSQLRIHPIQYSLVGGALVLFYLLLLALSEHIGFKLAYIVATAACSGVIGIYLCSVLKSKIRGGFFTVGLLALYGLLFIILHSEDQALLLGSILLFVVLSAIMLATRKVDWYALTDKMELKKVKTEQES